MLSDDRYRISNPPNPSIFAHANQCLLFDLISPFSHRYGTDKTCLPRWGYRQRLWRQPQVRQYLLDHFQLFDESEELEFTAARTALNVDVEHAR